MSTPLAVVLEGTVESDCPAVEAAELRENSDEIGEVLKALGYRLEIIPISLDVGATRDALVKLNPSVVFNLVDSIEGKGNLISIAPMLLAHLNIPYTGANALTTTVTCDKILTKQILRAHNITTADWLTESEIEAGGAELTGQYILKSITEHASFGMFSDSVVNTRAQLKTRWQEKKKQYGTEWFAERYIEGREFNNGVIASDNWQQGVALPASEIRFTADFPKDKPRIVDYAAKWHAQTPEYKGTVRNFEFEKSDTALLESMRQIVQSCWTAFGLTGYARVDFRVDENGLPYVLEVNSNPFLTAGEGIGIAAKRANLSFQDTIRIIVADAYRRTARPLPEMLAA